MWTAAPNCGVLLQRARVGRVAHSQAVPHREKTLTLYTYDYITTYRPVIVAGGGQRVHQVYRDHICDCDCHPGDG